MVKKQSVSLIQGVEVLIGDLQILHLLFQLMEEDGVILAEKLHLLPAGFRRRRRCRLLTLRQHLPQNIHQRFRFLRFDDE